LQLAANSHEDPLVFIGHDDQHLPDLFVFFPDEHEDLVAVVPYPDDVLPTGKLRGGDGAALLDAAAQALHLVDPDLDAPHATQRNAFFGGRPAHEHHAGSSERETPLPVELDARRAGQVAPEILRTVKPDAGRCGRQADQDQ